MYIRCCFVFIWLVPRKLPVPSRRTCHVYHTTMHQFTVVKATYIYVVWFSFLLYAGGGVLPWLPFTSFVISGLHDVMVVGVFDQDMGQEICACFVPSDPSMTEERVRSYVERDVMAKTEDPLSPRPRYYLRFTSFPTTFTFKPLRKDVRLQAAHKLNLNYPPPLFFFFLHQNLIAPQ